MKTLCFKYTILILLLFSVGTINAQLINKKELNETKKFDVMPAFWSSFCIVY